MSAFGCLRSAARYSTSARRIGWLRRWAGVVRVQIPVFLCLVYNPLVSDFFTVGRGYSLALARLIEVSSFCVMG